MSVGTVKNVLPLLLRLLRQERENNNSDRQSLPVHRKSPSRQPPTVVLIAFGFQNGKTSPWAWSRGSS
jgi:hypothetical protein